MKSLPSFPSHSECGFELELWTGSLGLLIADAQ